MNAIVTEYKCTYADAKWQVTDTFTAIGDNLSNEGKWTAVRKMCHIAECDEVWYVDDILM